MKRHFKKAFTLAEVLITLAVIGVVTAIVVPVLVQDSEKQSLVSSLLKAQSTLQQDILRYMADNSCLGDLTSCGGFSFGNSLTTASALKPYLSITKDCGYAAGCFANVMYRKLNGANDSIIDGSAGWGAKYILNDGLMLIIYSYNGNCNTSRSLTSDPNSPLYNTNCGVFYVDLNGDKGPNQEGRDTFAFRVLKNGEVVPQGAFDDTYGGCDPTDMAGSAGSGFGCTAKIIKEKAINY